MMSVMSKLKYECCDDLEIIKGKQIIIDLPIRSHKCYSRTKHKVFSNEEIKELIYRRFKLKPHKSLDFSIKRIYKPIRLNTVFSCPLEKRRLFRLENLNWRASETAKFDDSLEDEEYQREEFEKIKLPSEFDYFHLELDETESEAFIKMINEPNPNAEKYRKEAREMFKNINIHTDPIRLKVKKTKK